MEMKKKILAVGLLMAMLSACNLSAPGNPTSIPWDTLRVFPGETSNRVVRQLREHRPSRRPRQKIHWGYRAWNPERKSTSSNWI